MRTGQFDFRPFNVDIRILRRRYGLRFVVFATTVTVAISQWSERGR